MSTSTSKRRNGLVEKARALGYNVEFPDFCADAETPGMLGAVAGCVVAHRKAIKVSVRATWKRKRTERDICDILSHEIDHLTGDAKEGEPVGSVGYCGGTRNVWGEKISA